MKLRTIVIIGHRRIILADDGDGDRCRIRTALSVTDRILKDVGRGLSHAKRFELSVGIVVERAVTVVRNISDGTTRVDAGDG